MFLAAPPLCAGTDSIGKSDYEGEKRALFFFYKRSMPSVRPCHAHYSDTINNTVKAGACRSSQIYHVHTVL